jgi:hypothetical protein
MKGWVFLLPTVTKEDATAYFPEHKTCQVPSGKGEGTCATTVMPCQRFYHGGKRLFSTDECCMPCSAMFVLQYCSITRFLG